MSWCPDDAKVKKKMLYSSSFDALKKALVGVAKYIQVTNLLSFKNWTEFDEVVEFFLGYWSLWSFPWSSWGEAEVHWSYVNQLVQMMVGRYILIDVFE